MINDIIQQFEKCASNKKYTQYVRLIVYIDMQGWHIIKISLGINLYAKVTAPIIDVSEL